MSDTFAISIVTADGASLIAQATSTNQLVMVDALSCTLAATDAADLASKTASWYDGVSGTIESSSATNNVAKVIAKYGNAGAIAQPVKSVALRAKLANQADSAAVIIAAMSDADSEIVLPSSSSVAQIERVIFNFAINADEQTETVYADGATVADLDRFVSMWKAGDPTTGEYQIILGDKSFSDDVNIDGGLGVVGEVVISNDVEINGGLALDGELSVNSDSTFNGSIDVTTGNTINGVLKTSSSVGDLSTEYGMVGIKYSNTLRANLSFAGLYIYDTTETLNIKLDSGNGKITAESAQLGALSGLHPTVTGGVVTVPIGGYIFIWSSELITINNNIDVGTQIAIPANTAYSCKWSGLGGGTVGAYVKGSSYIGAGTYEAIMGSYMVDGGTNAPILFMRVG